MVYVLLKLAVQIWLGSPATLLVVQSGIGTEPCRAIGFS
jgi:hypothetical protein